MLCIVSGDYNDGSTCCGLHGIFTSAGSVLHSWNVSYAREVVCHNPAWFVAHVHFLITLNSNCMFFFLMLHDYIDLCK